MKPNQRLPLTPYQSWKKRYCNISKVRYNIERSTEKGEAMTIQIQHNNQLLNRPIRRSNSEINHHTTTPKWTNHPITLKPHSKESLSKLITF